MKHSPSFPVALCTTAFLFIGCSTGTDDGNTGGSSAGSTSASQSSSGGSPGGASSGSSSNSGGKSSGGSSSSTSSGGSSSAGNSGGSSSSSTSAGGASSAGGTRSAAGGTTSGSGGGGSTGGSGGGNGGSTAKGGTSGAGGAAGGTTSGGGTTAKGGSSDSGSDSCSVPTSGVTINGKKRFIYGVNFAWSADGGAANFGTDFGGLVAWNKKGVAAAKAARTTDMTEMKNNGVDVIRWWMFPSVGATDGIKLDSDKKPTGLGGTITDDLNAALEIAASLDLHIRLTLFSFDNFFGDKEVGGVTSVGIKPIITDDAKRAALIDNVVVPLAKAVEASPNKDRMLAWDVINEPEWSITGSDGYGDQAFDPQSTGSDGRTMMTVTFPQMETFVRDVVTALHANSKAPVTVGSAAVKWAKAWSKVGLDHYDFHWYGWVDQYFPHTKTPKDYGVDDKPVVVGEFPLVPNEDKTGQSFGGIKYGKLIDDWAAAGYAGAQGWAFSETQGAFSWTTSKADVKAWAEGKCYVHY